MGVIAGSRPIVYRHFKHGHDSTVLFFDGHARQMVQLESLHKAITGA
ncbi:hypothetical protein DLE54_00080 [Psychrobacter sp. YP14]|nr:hypothetical protein DLE54_00080 [Psychrobacter sp. YP14]